MTKTKQRKLKVLCTGGAGFIGTNLIKQLLKDGHNVTSLDNYDSGLRSNEQNGCNYITSDISDINKLYPLEFDVIFHLAALSRIQPSFLNPFETFRVNAEGTQHVMEWARYRNTKVIYAGSSSKHQNPTHSPYATYKYLGEEICKLYKNAFDVDVRVARFYNVYGPYEIIDGDWAAVSGIWRSQINNGKPITIVGDGEQRRDFTDVQDIVSGLILIMNTDEEPLDAWELGSGVNYSINELYDMYKKRFPHITKVHITDQKGNYRETIRVDDEAIELLGWKPTDKLNEFIQSL